MNPEHEAAKTLLDRGIKVEVTSPLCLRVFGKKTVGLVIRQPYLGTLIRISELYLRMGIDGEDIKNLPLENMNRLYSKHARTLAAIAAQAILNGYWKGKLFGMILTGWLLWKMKPVQLMRALRIVASINGSEAFMTTIRLADSLKVTSPTMSQTAEGS